MNSYHDQGRTAKARQADLLPLGSFTLSISSAASYPKYSCLNKIIYPVKVESRRAFVNRKMQAGTGKKADQ